MPDPDPPATDPVAIRALRETDLAGACDLAGRERWNQTTADWRRILRLDPGGAFAALDGERLVGTVTTVTYGRSLAWIGMMMVAETLRGRGIGKRLMRAALGHCAERGVATVKLDATPAGRPLYESLGFVAESALERWRGTATGHGETAPDRFDRHWLPMLRDLDRQAFRADRGALLDQLIAEAPVQPVVEIDPDGSPRGYALARHGANATYVGPIVALDEHCARRLLDRLLDRLSGPACLDLAPAGGALLTPLRERGFARERGLTRMSHGAPTSAGLSPSIHAIGGPEVG